MAENLFTGSSREMKMELDGEIAGMDSMPREMHELEMAHEQPKSLSPDSRETWERIRVKDGVELSYRSDALRLSEGKLRELIRAVRKLLKQS